MARVAGACSGGHSRRVCVCVPGHHRLPAAGIEGPGPTTPPKHISVKHMRTEMFFHPPSCSSSPIAVFWPGKGVGWWGLTRKRHPIDACVVSPPQRDAWEGTVTVTTLSRFACGERGTVPRPAHHTRPVFTPPSPGALEPVQSLLTQTRRTVLVETSPSHSPRGECSAQSNIEPSVITISASQVRRNPVA